MSSARKTRIAQAFDRAEGYDAHARIQREAARQLAAKVATLPIDSKLPALEIGCGTGFLTEALLAGCSPRRLLASDIAPAMIARARQRLGDRPGLDFELIDGEAPPAPPAGGWGLIASSLAFQWFEQPAAAIDRLAEMLAPGGWLAIATLAPGSLAEWSTALRTAGLGAVARDYPDPATLHPHAEIRCYDIVEQHRDGRAFLHSLKAIGAATRWNGTASPAGLRHAISAFEQGGAAITYRIAELIVRGRTQGEGS